MTATDTWRTSQNPAELLAMLVAPDERLLRVWTDAVFAEIFRLIPSREQEVEFRDRSLQWRVSQCSRNYANQIVSLEWRCNLLRCIFPPPASTVECPECKGRGHNGYDKEYNKHKFRDCFTCKGKKRIPAPPEPLPPWCYGGDVIGLARAARGEPPRKKCGFSKSSDGDYLVPQQLKPMGESYWRINLNDGDDELEVGDRVDVNSMGRRGAQRPIKHGLLVTKHLHGYFFALKQDELSVPWRGPPNLSILPILADALMDAGCYDEELLRHLRDDECHLPECWALAKVMAGIPKEQP